MNAQLSQTQHNHLKPHQHNLLGTVVWKIFAWNYFVIKNILIFVAYQYPRKYFNNKILAIVSTLIAIIILTP